MQTSRPHDIQSFETFNYGNSYVSFFVAVQFHKFSNHQTNYFLYPLLCAFINENGKRGSDLTKQIMHANIKLHEYLSYKLNGFQEKSMHQTDLGHEM